MAQRIYGHNLVFCKGKFISGPDAKSSIASFLMIFVPSILWQVYVGGFFARRYTAFIPFLFACLQIASMGLLLATAFSDPGIVPRQKDYTEQYDTRTKSFRTKQPARYYDLILRGHPFKLKYCTTCNIYRPPRCTHCSVCENCIERFDHHCPWIGNCIGKRNYWLFYAFVTFTAIVNTLVLTTALAQLSIVTVELQDTFAYGSGDAFIKAMGEEPLAAALVVYCAAIVWFTVGLCMYHNYLICTNQTTYEQIKGTYSSGHNPFHRGIVENYQDILFSRVRPRYFDAFTGKMLWPRATSEAARELKLTSSASTDSKGGDSQSAAAAGSDGQMQGSAQAPSVDQTRSTASQGNNAL